MGKILQNCILGTNLTSNLRYLEKAKFVDFIFLNNAIAFNVIAAKVIHCRDTFFGVTRNARLSFVFKLLTVSFVFLMTAISNFRLKSFSTICNTSGNFLFVKVQLLLHRLRLIKTLRTY